VGIPGTTFELFSVAWRSFEDLVRNTDAELPFARSWDVYPQDCVPIALPAVIEIAFPCI